MSVFVLTNVFDFIYRLRGLSPRWIERFVDRGSYIHRWMPLRKWEASFFPHDHDAWTLSTSSGQINSRTRPAGDVRSFGYPRTYPPQRPSTTAGAGRPVQPGTPPGERTRRRGQPTETGPEGPQAGPDWSFQERWGSGFATHLCTFEQIWISYFQKK